MGDESMHDESIGKMREAYALLEGEKKAGKASREMAVAMTELETAILWREHDLRLKTPAANEVAEG